MDFTSIIARIKAGDTTAVNELSVEEQLVVKAVIHELDTYGKSPTLFSLYDLDYEQQPPSIDKFIEDPFYLGNIGVNVFPLWREELRKIHSGDRIINEHIFRGCVGGGKTSAAVIELLYCVCKTLCLRNPQKTYGQMEGSPIVIGFFNIFQYLAYSTAYRYFTNWMKLSPFFADMLPKKNNKTEELRKEYIDLPKGLTIALGSSAIQALSQNLLYGLLDEADMYNNTPRANTEQSKIEELYNNAKTRIISRFTQHGGYNPGLLLLVSQVRDDQSFLSTHVEKTKNDPNTHLSQFALWQVKPHIFEGQKKFFVVVGSRNKTSYIVPDDVKPPDNERVIEVPVGLRSRFEYSIDDAIRDVAGIPTYGYRLFLPRRDKLLDCYAAATPREHPFTSNVIELSIYDNVNILDYFLAERCLEKSGIDTYRPRFHPNSPRAFHLDLAKNKCYAGIAMGCVGNIKTVTLYDRDGRPFTAKNYIIFIDFLLALKAKQGSEIDYSKIRSFIFYLKKMGFPIQFISADQYQSVDSQQTFKKEGYDVEQLSVDRTTDPYTAFRSTIMETRLDVYENEILTKEVTQLQDLSDIKGASPKIDHPENGSKDLADSCCAVTWRLSKENSLFVVQPEAWNPNDVTDALKASIKDESWVKGKVESENPLEELFK